MSKSGAKEIITGRDTSGKDASKVSKTPAPRQRRRKQPDVEIAKKAYPTVNELLVYSRRMLSLLAKEKEISQGIFYIADYTDNKQVLKVLSAYAYDSTDTGDRIFDFGEGFPGQVAKDRTLINISEVPDGYISIVSGLGRANPASLIIFPVIHDDKVLAVIELSSFQKFSEEDESFFTKFSRSVGERLAGLIQNF